MADAGAACRGGQGAVVGGGGERVGHQAAFRVGDQHPQLEGAAIACRGGEGADGFLRQRHVEGGTQAAFSEQISAEAGGLGGGNGLAIGRAGANLPGDAGDQCGVHDVAVGMGDGFALRDLGELAHHDGQHNLPDALGHAFIQRVAQKVAHLDEAGGGQAGALGLQDAHGECFGAPAGGENGQAVPQRGRDLHALHDAGAPGGGGKGLDDAGCAQDADAAQNAQPRVGGLARHFFAIGHADGHFQPMLGQQGGGRFAQVVGNVGARHGVDGRAAHFQPQPGHGDGAHARARTVSDGAGLAGKHAHVGGDEGAVGAVGVVACELDDGGMRRLRRCIAAPVAHGKAHAAAVWQQALHFGGHLAGGQPQCGGACGGGGARARGKSGARAAPGPWGIG